MRQIPSEGLYCGECIRIYGDPYWCPLYNERLPIIFDMSENISKIARLSQCLSDKPQVLTEKERKAIYLRAIAVYGGLNQQTPREDVEEIP